MESAVDVGGALALAALVVVVAAIAVGDPGLALPWRWRDLGPAIARGVGGLDSAATAIVTAAGAAIVAVVGSAALIGDFGGGALTINEEQSLPAYYSAVQLIVAGIVALGLAALLPEPEPVWPWLLLGVLLVVLGFDEAAEIHERLESRTGLPAIGVLAPAVLAGLVAFAGIFRRLRETPPALALFVAGAVAWAISQALDPIHGVDWKSALEESLELGGTALFLLALQRIARDLSSR